MTQAEENIIVDAWLQTMQKLIPRISERNHAEVEKSEQSSILQQIL